MLQVKGKFFPTNNTECVLGGLWLAMGEPRNHATVNPNRLMAHYNMPMDLWFAMSRVNDAHDDLEERRAALIALVELYITEE